MPNFLKKFFLFFLFFLFSLNIFASENIIEFEINGNQNTDKEVILSIINETTEDLNFDYSNYLLDLLYDSGLFQEIKINFKDNKYFIDVIEYPVINKIIFEGNERFKDEELNQISKDLKFNIYSNDNLNTFLNELKNIYSSFGYNDIKVNVVESINNQNLATIYIEIIENKITKIKSIKFRGNTDISNEELSEEIKSKVKTISNIFANNNFKPTQLETDKQRLLRFYREKGYADIKVNYEVEFFNDNSVVIYFNINEGNLYRIDKVNYIQNNNSSIDDLLNSFFQKNTFDNTIYTPSLAEDIENQISILIQNAGIKFYEIKKLVKLDEFKAQLLFEVKISEPFYVNNINIKGNTRTLDYVIRRELIINEGDSFLQNDLNVISKKINSLGFFKDVEVRKKNIDGNLVDIEISLKENQTGTFTAGASFGTLDGVTLLTGLNEVNFGGTGRGLEFMINNSENNNEYTLNSTDKFFLNRDIDLTFGLSYKENDYSKYSSYTLDKYKFTTGIRYKFQDHLTHSFAINYELDDIYITNATTASNTVKNVEGASAKYIFENGVTFNTLNSFLFPRNGNYVNFINTIETPTSSNNGYIKNLITMKKFIEVNKNITSFQAMIGNIYSLNDSDILPNDKFSLGGRWLRGFDNFGVGPRDSRTSYIGGNNILATKIDYSKLLLKNDDNPIYFNVFNDAGVVWDNKTTPTYSDEKIRLSAGFGIKFYSFIGPIAFTWGFPIEDESYDIKRMFIFSIGNIN